MLLGINILLGDGEVVVVVDALAHLHGDFESDLFAAEHGAGAFAHAHGVARAEGVETKHLTAFQQ